ncbi:MAG: GTP-binding protein [Bacteroidales bacterium]|nr:GTP-binding protein [Bacteroidales bacterium]
MKKQLPILLLTGYLGSGKTTLVNHILTNERGIRFAVIVNDIGEINIDADLIQKGGVVGKKDDSLVALQNGCICCTLKMDLIAQIDEIIAMGRFDYLVIEASGICEPAPIAQTICMMPTMSVKRKATPHLDCICTVVDALRLRDEFACGESLQAENLDEEDIENLIIQQIEFCDIILLNKISELTLDEANRVRKIVRAIQPRARIIECDYCDVDLNLLLNTHDFDFERVATSATWIRELDKPVEDHDDDHEHDHHHDDHDHDDSHEPLDHLDSHDNHDSHDSHGHHHHHHDHDHGEAEEYGIGTFVYYTRRPLDLNKFDWMIGSKWPKNIIRCKGICYFQDNRRMSYLFETAGKQKKLSESGLWYAEAPKEELEQMMLADPTIMRDWDPEYGDRMVKLVFIGQNLDRQAITQLMDMCLA